MKKFFKTYLIEVQYLMMANYRVNVAALHKYNIETKKINGMEMPVIYKSNFNDHRDKVLHKIKTLND